MGVVSSGKARRFRSKQERRAIVEETLRPGASVSLVARAHDINANQLFTWRRLYREGRLEVSQNSTALVAVKIRDDVQTLQHSNRKSKPLRAGIIDIDLGHARVRIEGAADPACVRAAIERLIR